MRALVSLVLLGALTAPALAGGYGHRGHHRHFGRHHHHYRGHHYRYGRYRGFGLLNLRHDNYYRAFGHRYYRSYRYRYHRPYRYSCYYYRPRAVRLAPIYGRVGVVFTLDDDAFTGAPATVDYDGLPQPRGKPVGERFLVSLK